MNGDITHACTWEVHLEEIKIVAQRKPGDALPSPLPQSPDLRLDRVHFLAQTALTYLDLFALVIHLVRSRYVYFVFRLEKVN